MVDVASDCNENAAVGSTHPVFPPYGTYLCESPLPLDTLSLVFQRGAKLRLVTLHRRQALLDMGRK